MVTSSQHPLFQLPTIPELLATAGKLSLSPSLGSDLGPARTLLVRRRVSTGLARSQSGLGRESPHVARKLLVMSRIEF